MKAPQKLTMTVICHTCENQYGAWRTHCPACGTSTPMTAFNTARVVVAQKQRRQKERGNDDCIFCHKRKAKERCAHCNEPIHQNCRGLHGGACQQFQVEREAEIARVSA